MSLKRLQVRLAAIGKELGGIYELLLKFAETHEIEKLDSIETFRSWVKIADENWLSWISYNIPTLEDLKESIELAKEKWEPPVKTKNEQSKPVAKPAVKRQMTIPVGSILKAIGALLSGLGGLVLRARNLRNLRVSRNVLTVGIIAGLVLLFVFALASGVSFRPSRPMAKATPAAQTNTPENTPAKANTPAAAKTPTALMCTKGQLVPTGSAVYIDEKLGLFEFVKTNGFFAASDQLDGSQVDTASGVYCLVRGTTVRWYKIK